MTQAQHKIVNEMRQAVPSGLPQLDFVSREMLRDLTTLLLDEPGADDEYRRYRSITTRRLSTDRTRRLVNDSYRGARIVVTGGTGCIGGQLLRQLVDLEPAELFSVQALSAEHEPVPGVVYLDLDVRDERATRDTIRAIAPDVIFHCAAQRSPWLAEREVERTIATNVLGTRNLLRAARDVELPRFVHASTGKAMRYYTTDVYAASKKLAEWLVNDYAAEGRGAGFARFTHVVDNAVVVDKIDESLDGPAAVMRVHDPDTHFYAQSATESAQLLVLAGLGHGPGLRGVAIRELGEPVRLVDLVVGRLRERRCAGVQPVVYFSGYDKGYERGQPPGLYDPSNAAELSPLINAVEAQTAAALPGLDDVDEFRVALPARQRQAELQAARLEQACRGGQPMRLRAELTRAAARQADVALRQCPAGLFARLKAMADRAGEPLPTSRGVRTAA